MKTVTVVGKSQLVKVRFDVEAPEGTKVEKAVITVFKPMAEGLAYMFTSILYSGDEIKNGMNILTKHLKAAAEEVKASMKK